MPPIEDKAGALSPAMRNLIRALIIVLVLGFFIGAACIPFFYQSTSMWYKFGVDRILLRTGKVIGMLAASLLLLQLLLAANLKIVTVVFPRPKLIKLHKFNAGLLAVLALIHPLFIFAPEDISTIPLEWKYWPEIVGAFLLLLIWFIFTTGRWREFLQLSFPAWRLFHRIAVITAFFLLALHVFFVSDTFQAGLPRYAVFLSLGSYFCLWLWLRIRTFLGK